MRKFLEQILVATIDSDARLALTTRYLAYGYRLEVVAGVAEHALIIR
jgi:hypothetical protein